MNRLSWIALFVGTCGLLASSGCGTLDCGVGTFEEDGECKPTAEVLTCGVGFKAVAGSCVPDDDWKKTACGKDTQYNDVTGLCEGTGGGGATCTKQCPAPQGNKVCLSGRVLKGTEVLMQGASNASPVTTADGLKIQIYDPVALASDPNPPLLAETTIYNDAGCYIIESLEIPFSGFWAITMDDAKSSDNKWTRTFYGWGPTANENSVNVEVTAFTTAETTAWGNDIVKNGALLLWYRTTTDSNIEGVTPTRSETEPPWPNITLFYFDKDMTKAPYFDTSATKTTTAGFVAARGGGLGTYGGKKAGCNILSGTGGSAPGTLFVRVYRGDGDGC